MFYRLLLLCFFAGFVAGGNAQVRLLTLGGNLGTFSGYNLGKNLGASEKSLPETREDSMIFISDSLAVVVSKGYCSNGFKKTARFWKVRKDTSLNHPVFAGEHCIDAEAGFLENPVIKKILDSMKIYASGKTGAQQGQQMMILSVPQPKGFNSNMTIAITTVILAVIAYVALIADRYMRMRRARRVNEIRPPGETLSSV